MELIHAGRLVLKKLNEAGYEAYFVGGMVRDRMLGREVYDVDVTTSAPPDVVLQLFEKTIATGLAHGTVTVMLHHIPVEVTTFRVESGYLDYRRPQAVAFTASLEEDLLRRDFTINAMAQDLAGKLYDPMKGQVDLDEKILRAVGNPEKRFEEDPLRMLRGLRFVSKLGFKLEEKTFEAMVQKKTLIRHLAKERVKKELEGLMTGSNKEQGLRLLFETGVFAEFDGFSSLKPFQMHSFANLLDGLDLFALVGLNNESLEKRWPLSKQEKKVVKLLREWLGPKGSHPDIRVVQYSFGEDLATRYERMDCFLKQIPATYKPLPLVIHTRKDLAIDVKLILEVVNRPGGPWLQVALRKLEEAVLMGDLANEVDELIEFLQQVVKEV